MANKVTSMQHIRLLIQFLEKGFSLRAIAAELKLSLQPVTEYAKRLKGWHGYNAECPDPYQYIQFCIRLKEASKVAQASIHLVHDPAAMVIVDFAGDKMQYTEKDTGKLINCPVLVAVLPFSKYTFA